MRICRRIQEIWSNQESVMDGLTVGWANKHTDTGHSYNAHPHFMVCVCVCVGGVINFFFFNHIQSVARKSAISTPFLALFQYVSTAVIIVHLYNNPFQAFLNSGQSWYKRKHPGIDITPLTNDAFSGITLLLFDIHSKLGLVSEYPKGRNPYQKVR